MVTDVTYFTDKSESKSIDEMYISVNTSKVKDTKDKEPSVMDIQLINALGHFKLFKCRQEFLNNLDANYEHACMENVKDKYWTDMYDTITIIQFEDYRSNL